MKHLNEWLDFGKKAGDDFVNSLLDIAEKENVEIRCIGDEYYFEVDDISYGIDWTPTDMFDNIADYYYITIKSGPKVSYKTLKISKKYYTRLKSLYKKQERKREKEEEEKIISELPDISEIGRTSKKYNL